MTTTPVSVMTLDGEAAKAMRAAAAEIERDAASIASAMAAIHGGDWHVHIDHLAGLVMVVRH
ncbi:MULTISPECIES: hypothetical protein [unclassified Mesorhizobium]|uniref:hypothetical protein n=1 Tax=unclassified Mesorhizobium TaxID=325217 RepID=UPI000FCA7DF1|nr:MULTISPECIES: hypothetical protein [unclassified Mesorhizobium]RUX95826.1 hypothetical protein EN993_10080 [Mesorhizobium sp. M7D.F.Ca.US.004.01.2.1]RVA25268.1 hypothetical protein EN935_24610 [Mesorhizobium sp. M7D.F.Ca.US.004.03.1.1]